MPDYLEKIDITVTPLRGALLGHEVYDRIRDFSTLHVFMQHHIFAVWDFMSLLKTLQNRLCCNTVPWMPPVDGDCCRFLNEIVLGEESDERPGGGYASHFELYHRAMQQCGAATDTIDHYMEQLRAGADVSLALENSRVPEAVRRFVQDTFLVIESGGEWEMAAAFVYGREDLLPAVFQQLVASLNRQQQGRLDDFIYYLNRHIELDGDEHGPLARKMLATLCGQDANRWQAAENAAVATLQSRLRLWDAISAAIDDAPQARSA